MPTKNSFRHDRWKHDMDLVLNESDDYDSPYDFLDGFLQREKRADRFVRQTKPSRPNFAASRHNLEQECLDNSSKNKPFSGNDFVDGFSQRQENSDRFVQHDTKASKSSVVSGGNLGKRERLDNSTENKKFSAKKDFFDGFSQRKTDPLKPNYERGLLDNSVEQNKQLSYPNCTQKPPTASGQKRDGFVCYTKSSKFASSERKLDDHGRLNLSTDWTPSEWYTSKPPFASTQTPSPSTQYVSTRTSSSKSSSTSQGELDEQEWPKSSTDHHDRQNHSQRYTKKPSIVSVQTPSPSTQYMSTTTTTSRSNSYFYASHKISEAEWKELEEKSQNEQKEFLNKFLEEGKFKDELVSSHTNNIKRGDHILCQGALGKIYNHHFLCTRVHGNRISLIEYSGPSFGVAAASRSAATSDVLGFAAIKEGSLTYQELEKKKAKIRIWPKELQRFSVDDVILRAKSRLGKKERDYHLFSNNCESFVNWCICGLNTSLQVEPWYQPAWDGVKAVGSAAIEGLKNYGVTKGVPLFLKAVGNVSDEIIGTISSSLSAVGFAVGGVIETGFAAWSITKDLKRMREGSLSKSQFKINSVATASKAAGHIAGGITGSLIGSVAGPVGSVVGGAIGYGVGHAVGSAVSWCYEHAPKIKKKFEDYVIAPVKRVVGTCVNAVKSAAKTVWEEVKGVFSSLFSWW